MSPETFHFLCWKQLRMLANAYQSHEPLVGFLTYLPPALTFVVCPFAAEITLSVTDKLCILNTGPSQLWFYLKKEGGRGSTLVQFESTWTYQNNSHALTQCLCLSTGEHNTPRATCMHIIWGLVSSSLSVSCEPLQCCGPSTCSSLIWWDDCQRTSLYKQEVKRNRHR